MVGFRSRDTPSDPIATTISSTNVAATTDQRIRRRGAALLGLPEDGQETGRGGAAGGAGNGTCVDPRGRSPAPSAGGFRAGRFARHDIRTGCLLPRPYPRTCGAGDARPPAQSQPIILTIRLRRCYRG